MRAMLRCVPLFCTNCTASVTLCPTMLSLPYLRVTLGLELLVCGGGTWV
jgi:hypothetical protein